MTAPAFAQPDAGWQRPPLPAPAGALATHVIATIKDAAASAPRSLQAAPGPSELGTPCTRRLAYRALDWPKSNTDTDPWAAIQGTSVHAWMAETFAAADAQAEHEGWPARSRYLIERRVTLPGGIEGNCDLYDRETATVIDWKVTGLPRLKQYRRDGPGPQYRTQAHLYALGLQLAGEQPAQVAIVFLPRGGRIDDLHAWTEPYDPQVAVEGLKRYQAVQAALAALDPETSPGRWGLFPTADAYCTYCPWFLPASTDLGKGCPGHNTQEG